MRTVEDLVSTLIGEIAATPWGEARDAAMRRAASALIGYASRPRNAAVAPSLRSAAAAFLSAAAPAPDVERLLANPDRPPVGDDFTDMMLETDIADQASHHDIDREARRNEVHAERLAVGQVSIAPASFKDGAALGRTATVRYPTSRATAPAVDPAVAAEDAKAGISAAETLCMWQGSKRETQAMTVDVSVAIPPKDAVLDSSGTIVESPVVRPFVRVTFGADGTSSTVEVDAARGARVTVPGNFVAVLVGCDPVPLNTKEYSGAVTYAGSVAAFAAHSAAPVLRTLYVDNLEGAGPGSKSKFFRIPARAVQLLPPLADSTVAGTIGVAFFAGIRTPVGFQTFPVSAYQANPIGVPCDATHVQVTNFMGTKTNYRLMFQLNF